LLDPSAREGLEVQARAQDGQGEEGELNPGSIIKST
jgi:hypothetical protein